MKMNEKQYSTGQAAKLSGLTIRTLQHYDNIGLLRSSGRTEGGRRYYTESDLIKLEHVVFYRGVGLTLEQIKENLLDRYSEQKVEELLSLQEQLLYYQIYKLQDSIAAIKACREIAASGKNPPWMLLAAFMQSLSTVDFSIWKDVEFTEEQTSVFKQDFQTFDEVMEFYNTWKHLSIKAAAFLEAGIDVASPVSQKLAEDWEAMVEKLTHGNAEHTSAYLEVDQKRDIWNPAERELMEKAEPYLNEILEYYRRNKIR
jgi:DNA-binding transcriptional MerR regulator